MQKTTSPGVKTLSILHLALFAGQFTFAMISLLLVFLEKVPSSSLLKGYPQQVFLLAAAVGAVGFLVGKKLFVKKLQQINMDSVPINDKMNGYRAACILRWAMLEGPSLFCIILFLLTNDYKLLIIVAILLGVFLSLRPTVQKVATDLQITETDLEQNNTGDGYNEAP